MSAFNRESRTKNVLLSSSAGVVCKLIDTLLAFAYRTIFIQILSANYLGINGLFSNILSVLTFADLGIAAAIVFRFYEPINNGDVQRVGELMRFFKRVYRIIAVVISAAGLALLPFLEFFVKDTSELPADVNIYVVYLLFLLQTVATYTYAYKLTILRADQRNYILSILNTCINLLSRAIQIIALVIWHSYILTLIGGIAVTILINVISSMWAQNQYKDVFAVKSDLPEDIKQKIYKDTFASLCHKVGGTVLNSTDSIILSKYAGLVATGLYSNYSIILSSFLSFFNQLLGNFISSLGSAYVGLKREENHAVYLKMLFLNLWLSGVCTVCLYVLCNDFIELWIGKGMLLDNLTVAVLCIQFYFESSRVITKSFITGSGIFVDKARPFIEATINLVVSIILVSKIGIAGVFLGTIVSHLLTVFWREPYNLYRISFQCSWKSYWINFGIFSVLTAIMTALIVFVKGYFNITIDSWFSWFIEAVSSALAANFFFVLILRKRREYEFYKEFVRKIHNKIGGVFGTAIRK